MVCDEHNGILQKNHINFLMEEKQGLLLVAQTIVIKHNFRLLSFSLLSSS